MTFLSLLKQTVIGWQKDNATVWSAALAYYTVFSLGPLLLLIISIVGLVFSKSSLESNIHIQLEGLLGNNGANMLITLIQHTKKPSADIVGAIIGFITLLLGASGVFGQLQQMLNAIWGVTQKPKSGVIALITSRLLNFSMVGVIAFLLVVSLVASSIISGIGTFFSHILPFSSIVLESIDSLISFIIITVLFAFILKVLPDVQIKWKAVWWGALLTSLLFTVGKTIIGIYIGHSGVSSTYGAAAALIILLLWVYYSTQILFFGIEFTKAYTLMTEKKIIPSKYAVLASVEEKKQEGKELQNKNTATKIASGFTKGFLDEINRKMKN